MLLLSLIIFFITANWLTDFDYVSIVERVGTGAPESRERVGTGAPEPGSRLEEEKDTGFKDLRKFQVNYKSNLLLWHLF